MFTKRQYINLPFALLMGTVLFTACNRPTAYFQPSPREHFTTIASTPAASTHEVLTASLKPAPTEAIPVEAAPSQSITSATSAMNQVDALVSSDAKLATNKAVHKQLDRIRDLLTTTTSKAKASPRETAAPKKANLMERLMLKKMNHKINKHLAPNAPQRAMADKHTLVIGAILILGSILLLALSASTTLNVIGVIALIVGLIALLLGLLGGS